jgi:DNA-directed RNA polymerase subunit M/transcription elongation factor TFIIS
MWEMPYCFECGGEMFYDREVRSYICQKCGSTYTTQDLLLEREKRFNSKFKTDEKRRRREEYLQWWLSSK